MGKSTKVDGAVLVGKRGLAKERSVKKRDSVEKEKREAKKRKKGEEQKGPTAKVFPSKRTTSANETKESKQKKADLKEDGSADDSYEETDDKEPQRKKMKVLLTGAPLPIAKNQCTKATKRGDSSDEENSDDELKTMQQLSIASKESSSEDGNSSEDTFEEEEEQPSRTPKKNDLAFPKSKTKQCDFRSEKKAAQSPATVLHVSNLSFLVQEVHLQNFFKDYKEEIVEIRLAYDENDIPKGFGLVKFATVEAAKKALKLDGKDLLGRPMNVEFAEEGSPFTQFFSEINSNQKGGKAQGQTISVQDFDRSSDVNEIRDALEEHFANCGEILRVSIPEDYDDGLGWIAYIFFRDSDAVDKALLLDGCGSELAGSCLKVKEVNTKGDGIITGGTGTSGGQRSKRKWAGKKTRFHPEEDSDED